MENNDVVAGLCVEVTNICNVAIEVLSDWVFDKNLQFPALAEKVCFKLGITDDSGLKEVDSILRAFIKRHPDYVGKRGVGGGIALASAENQRRSLAAARLAAKNEAKEKVEAKLNADKKE